MSSSTDGTGVGRITDVARRSLADLTDGQRWSVGVLLVVTVLFLSFGLRRGTATLAPFAASVGPPVAAGASTPSTTVVQGDGALPPATRPTVDRVPRIGGVPADDGTPAVPVDEAPADEPVPVVAVVRNDTGSIRGDGAVAAVFLRDLAGARAVSLDDAADVLCDSDEQLVLASGGLPAALRECVVASGGVLLSHDDAGSSGRALSTALGATAALIEAGRTAEAGATLGLVSRPGFEPAVDRARTELESEGFAVSTAIVPPDGGPLAAAAIVDFLRADVETVVFATTVSGQGRWLSLAGTLRAPFEHVVADVDDAITNESYPPEAAGLRAVAATRGPWYERAHGATGKQQGCRSRYEAGSGSEVTSGRELADVYLWCQHVAMAEQIIEAGGIDGLDDPFDAAMTSPLTSDTATGFGPREVASLEWDQGCSCWTEAAPYTARREVA